MKDWECVHVASGRSWMLPWTEIESLRRRFPPVNLGLPRKLSPSDTRPAYEWVGLARKLRNEGRLIPEYILRRARLWFDPEWRKHGIPEYTGRTGS